MDRFSHEAVQKIQHESSGMDGWIHLMVLGVPWLSKENLDKAAKTVCTADVVRLVKQDAESGMALCRTLAEIASCSGDKSALTAILNQLEQVSEFLAAHYVRVIDVNVADRDEPTVIAVVELVEAAFRLSTRENPHAAVGEFARAIERIADSWPASIPFLRHLCDQFLRRLPFDWTDQLWVLNLKLRATR